MSYVIFYDILEGTFYQLPQHKETQETVFYFSWNKIKALPLKFPIAPPNTTM